MFQNTKVEAGGRELHIRKFKKEIIGLFDVVGIVFISLKLTGVIGWNWWWVISPWWISLLLGFVFFLSLTFLLGYEAALHIVRRSW